MNKFFTLLICSFFLLKTAVAQPETVDAIKSNFAKYNKAISAQNGKEAVNYVDHKTIAYYDKILNFAKTSDSAKVSQLPLLDKLTVLVLRNQLTKQEIKSFDGKTFLAYSFDNRMNKSTGFDLGEITIKANNAKAQITIGDKSSTEYIEFNQEDGLWKIDLTSVFPLTEKYMKDMIQKNFEGDENKFCLSVANGAAGKEAKKNIWTPIE